MARERGEARIVDRRDEPRIDAPAGSARHVHGRDDEAAGRAHAEMLRRWIWRDYANIVLGVWLATSPITLGYRDIATSRSDVISGVLIVVFGILTLSPRFDLLRWGICLVGIWLLFAPLVFWTPDASAYANDTLIGALVIAFSVVIPMMPSRAHHEVMSGPGPDIPPGWSYNPSDWMQRGPIIAMAFVGVFLSRYLAAYQLGHIAYPWDPFFGDGTRQVLDSEISKAWPISDAGLGATSYMLEALSGFMGGRNRWRTMPWMVAMFGILVVPLGIVSIVLVMLQPIAVGAWCTLCLITAAAMLIMVSPAVDEVVAMSQFLQGARREGKPFWRTFWVGGTLDAHRRKVSAGAIAPFHNQGSTLSKIVAAMDLNHVPWNLLLCTAIGIWLMAEPTVFGTIGAAANLQHMAGALVVTWAVIGFGEIVRPMRLLNVLMGLVIAAAPWMLAGDTALTRFNDVIAGIALMALSLPHGSIEQRFGSWNRYLAW